MERSTSNETAISGCAAKADTAAMVSKVEFAPVKTAAEEAVKASRENATAIASKADASSLAGKASAGDLEAVKATANAAKEAASSNKSAIALLPTAQALKEEVQKVNVAADIGQLTRDISSLKIDVGKCQTDISKKVNLSTVESKIANAGFAGKAELAKIDRDLSAHRQATCEAALVQCIETRELRVEIEAQANNLDLQYQVGRLAVGVSKLQKTVSSIVQAAEIGAGEVRQYCADAASAADDNREVQDRRAALMAHQLSDLRLKRLADRKTRHLAQTGSGVTGKALKSMARKLKLAALRNVDSEARARAEEDNASRTKQVTDAAETLLQT